MKFEYLLFYFPIVLRSVFFFANDDLWGLRALNRWAGRAELYLGWLRDYFFILYSLWILGHRIEGWMTLGFFWVWPLEVVFLALAAASRWWRWHGLAVLQEFARLNPCVHPSEFFDHGCRRLGFFPHRLPQKARSLIDPDHLDFRTGKKPRRSFWLLLCGVYDTFLFATLAYKAFVWKGERAIRSAGSGLSVVWASRIAQIAKMKVTVKRPDSLETVRHGRLLFALNHTSFFDFCLAPLAYREENKDGSSKDFIPSIMVAKDHFKDNFFLYRVVGFGRMLEAWGMVFVDRKSKEALKALQTVRATVNKLLSNRMSFAVYPQATRAWGQKDRCGERWDAAYFCVGRKGRLQKEDGHFKKGIGHIAVELAEGLKKHRLGGEVFVVPVAIAGPGTACPKGSLRVQTETEVSIQLGEPLRVEPQTAVEKLCRGIDSALQKLLEVRARLERRFFTDLRALLDTQGIEEVSVAFREWREQGNLIYAMIDCIYALPQKQWRPLLVEFSSLLRRHITRDDLTAFRNKLAGFF